MTGTADLALDEAGHLVRNANHTELSERFERELLGRNVIEGRWTFQIVEDYDDNYYDTFRDLELDARTTLANGRRCPFEAEMRDDRLTHHARHHHARPSEPGTRHQP